MKKEINLGEELFFIISQPRSGSTLLQHILGSHSEIHTLPEPWVMLPKIYESRSQGVNAEYNAYFASQAIQDFLDRIPDGKETYLNTVRESTLKLYRQSLVGINKSYFLDKTPRYYHIIPEINRVFPAAKIIILKRHLLSVLSSLIKQNGYRGIFTEDRRHDIFTAPFLINQAVEAIGQNIIVVHYEDLVKNPLQTIEELCRFLSIDFQKSMIQYGSKVKFKDTSFIDYKSIYKNNSPTSDYIEQWIEHFQDPQLNHIAENYIKSLGKTTVEDFGYSYDLMLDILNNIKPTSGNNFIVPWDLLMKDNFSLKKSDSLKIRFLDSLQSRGFWGTLRHGIMKMKNRL